MSVLGRGSKKTKTFGPKTEIIKKLAGHDWKNKKITIRIFSRVATIAVTLLRVVTSGLVTSVQQGTLWRQTERLGAGYAGVPSYRG